jgi:hypothetical protein
LDKLISVFETIITHIVNIDICEIEKNPMQITKNNNRQF